MAQDRYILDLSNAVKEIGYESPLPVEDAVFLNSAYRARYPAALGLLPTGGPTDSWNKNYKA